MFPLQRALVELQIAHAGLRRRRLVRVLGHTPHVAKPCLAQALELLHRLVILLLGQEVAELPLQPLACAASAGLVRGGLDGEDGSVQ